MTNTVNTRALVLEMLMAINEDGQYSHLVLRDVLDKYQYLSKQERAFLTRLTEGTVEKQITLDYVIDHFFKDKGAKDETIDSQPYAAECLPDHVYGWRTGFCRV